MWASGRIGKHVPVFDGALTGGEGISSAAPMARLPGQDVNDALERRPARRSCSVRASGCNTHVFNMRHLVRRKLCIATGIIDVK
jgi:hypothetical protein